MRRADFSYELPAGLIAQAPLPGRSSSRLLSCDGATGDLRDLAFRDLPGLLAPGDLLVLNDTRVLPARVHGRKPTGGAVEILLERLTGEASFLAQARSSKGFRPGATIDLPGGARATVTGREGDLFRMELDTPAEAYFEAWGEMPLPPYIERPADAADRERYQTVFAREPGAVAAPTAGLHFDDALFDELGRRGIETARLTLHVGAGTFQPVRADDVRGHRMHAERVRVGAPVVAAVERARGRGARVVAVGTTAVRGLEAAAARGRLQPFEGETDLFIYPGFRFRVVDAMITNFHLPESTLLMLVCAFAGRDTVLRAYRHAVEARYRFFSYGDAMLLLPAADALAPREAA
jgi:S-adenosylmethionine:tRNA ribosyltransferase-isomerase